MRQISNSLAMRHKGLCSSSLKVVLLAAISWFWQEGGVLAEPELSLSWSAQEPLSTCPDLAWAMTRVASEIGRAPIADVAQGVHAIVTIEKRASGLLLSLRTEVASTHGERVIEGDNCRDLSEAAILIVALSVAQAGDARERGGKEATAQATSVDENGERRKAESTLAGSTHATRLGFLLRPELVAELGLLLRPTLGPGLAVGLEWGHFRAELAGTWLLYGDMRKASQQIEARLGAVRVSGCALFGTGHVRGGPCLGVELGDVAGRNPKTRVENHTLWAATSLAGRLWVALGSRLALVLDADAVASWGRLHFLRASDDEPRATVHRSKPVQLRAHTGLEISF